MEDGEGNKCLYSESNPLASVTCHTSLYIQHLRIEIHFTKWDETKYECLGMFSIIQELLLMIFLVKQGTSY